MSLTTDQIVHNVVTAWAEEASEETTGLAVELQKAISEQDWANVAKIGASLVAYATTMAAIEQFVIDLDKELS